MQSLAMRLVREQAEQAASPQPAAVMVHLHGAWGSGKSSMVHLLADVLEREHRPWLVVEFNAWRNARAKPPWWNMLLAMQEALLNAAWPRGQAYPAPPLPTWFWLKAEFAIWRMTQESAQFGVATLALLLFLGLWLFAPAIAMPNGGAFTTTAKEWTGLVGSLISALLVARAWFLGGRPTAEAFDALRTDAFRPFIDLFRRLVELSGKPILIVLDDLDRCDSGTVTDLLEGIQTLFRGAPVVFLAVADRRWITASFAKRFADFQDAGGDAARPVGDLFLDKMFQLSVGVPQIGKDTQENYLRYLLGVDGAAPPRVQPPPLPAGVKTLEAGQAVIAGASPDQRPAVIAQVALRLSEQPSDAETQHRLLEWVEFIEPNPRAIKRVVNAVGMAQTRVVLEQRAVDFDTIALWTILELRWPRVADAIVSQPDVLKSMLKSDGQLADLADLKEATVLKEAMRDPAFKALINTAHLHPLYLSALIDNPQFPRSSPSRIKSVGEA